MLSRREFLKLALSVPVVLAVSPLAASPFGAELDYDYIRGIDCRGLGEESSLCSVRVFRGSKKLLDFHFNAFGGMLSYLPPAGDKIIWTDDMRIEVRGLSVAHVARKDVVEIHTPYGLINSIPYERKLS